MKKTGGRAARDAKKGQPSPSSNSRSIPKSSFELAMERLRAADEASGATEAPLTASQKKQIAQARRVAASRLAEREILFQDELRKTNDPAAQEQAEREYQIDRRRIQDDSEKAIDGIRRSR